MTAAFSVTTKAKVDEVSVKGGCECIEPNQSRANMW